MRYTIHWDFFLFKVPTVFLGPLAFEKLFDLSIPYWGMVAFLTVVLILVNIKFSTSIERR